MKAINTLNIILAIIFYFSILGLLVLFAQIIGIWTYNDFGDFAIKMSRRTVLVDELDNSTKISLSILFFTQALYTYCLFLLKKNFKMFSSYIFFSDSINKNFKLIGTIYLSTFFIEKVILVIEDSWRKSNLDTIFIDINSLASGQTSNIIVGLFFLSMGYVLNMAKKYKDDKFKLENENIELKQENELTI